MFNIGDKVWWVSARGYSLPGGQAGEVYRVDTARQIACINVEGDDQNPEGYSYPVAFSELSKTVPAFDHTARPRLIVPTADGYTIIWWISKWDTPESPDRLCDTYFETMQEASDRLAEYRSERRDADYAENLADAAEGVTLR